MSGIVDFGFLGVSATARGLSSDQRCSLIRRTLRAHTIPSPVLTRCSSVRSVTQQVPTCQPASTWDIPNPFPPHADDPARIRQQFSTVGTTHGTRERRLRIVTSETRNKPSCMTDDALHAIAVSRRSALCAAL